MALPPSRGPIPATAIKSGVARTDPLPSILDQARDDLDTLVADLAAATGTAGGAARLAADGKVVAAQLRPVDPSGTAGGVLSGSYPNPGFATAQATTVALTAHADDTTGIHGIADTAALVATTDPRLDDPRALTVGEETVPRVNATLSSTACTSGALALIYFTARKTEAATQVRVLSGGTAAGATPTLCRIGLYSVADNGDLTLAGATANDTTLFAAASTRYTRSLTASMTKTAGLRYAFGVLVVSAAALPTFVGLNPAGSSSPENAEAPRLTGQVSGLTDLPATVAAAAVGTRPAALYGVVLP